ncbi:MAG TPA: hypothetical protein VNK91_07665 [Burkholderiaceae bacterium]|nr:hypothetical protein [Burkholderiaceae bacterium]
MAQRKQVAAAELQLRQLSPFAETGAYLVASKTRATVWYWDNAEVERAAASQGLNTEDLWVVPETLMYSPAIDGLRLVACADGVEAQRWEGGVIVASQWWPHEPSPAEWSLFARQLGPAAADVSRTVPPAVQHPPRLRVPWATNALPGGPGAARRDVEKGAYALLGTALLLWSGWLGGAWLKLEWEARRVAAEYERLTREAAPVMEARRAALDDARVVEAISAVAKYPDPRLVLADLAEALPADGLTVAELELRDGVLRARLSASAPHPPISNLVERLNGSSWLVNAKASTESGGRVVNVTANVRAKPPTAP